MIPRAIATLGFAPHSGWAAVVGLGEVEARPRVLLRERIEMADPRRPESRQPYHAVEGLFVDEASQRLAAYRETAELMAQQAIEQIVDRLAQDGYRVTGLGILESAGRKGSSLAEILASHALIHGADGDHFRHAIATAAARCHLAVSRVRARHVEAEVVAAMGYPAPVLQQALKELGRRAGPPWGADQKAAALLAWLLIATGSADNREAGRASH